MKVYGLTPLGVAEYEALCEEYALYRGIRNARPDEKTAYAWAHAAEEAYAADPEKFILTGKALDGVTRLDIIRGLLEYQEAEEDENGDIIFHEITWM